MVATKKQDSYQDWAAFYDEFRNEHTGSSGFLNWEIYLFASKYTKEKGPLLDLGCGTGKASLWFAQRGYDVTGVDLSAGMLAIARENAKKEGLSVEFLQQDITELSIDKKFSAIFSKETMAHLLEDGSLEKAIMCCFQHLAPKGVLVFSMGAKENVKAGYSESSGQCSRFSWKAESTYDAATSINNTKYIFKFNNGKEVVIPITQRVYAMTHVMEALKSCGFCDVASMDTKAAYKIAGDTIVSIAFQPVTSATTDVLYGARKQ